MRHEEDEEEEGGGRKGERQARMMIRIMTSWALGMCCGDVFFADSQCHLGALLGSSRGLLGVLLEGLGALLGLFGGVWEASWGRLGLYG